MAASDSAIFSFSFWGFTSTKASWNIFFHSRLFPSGLKFSIETSYIHGRRPSKPTWNVVVPWADGKLLLRQSILSPNVKVPLVSQCFNRNSTARGRAMNGGTQIRQLDPHFGQRYFERRTRRRRPQLFEDALDEVASTHCGGLGVCQSQGGESCMIVNDLPRALLRSLQCARFCDFALTSLLRHILAMWQGINVFTTKRDMAI